MARFQGSSTPPTIAAPYASGTSQAGLADRVTGLVFCDQAGTLFFDQASVTASTGLPFWDYTQSQAVTANTGVGFSYELLAPMYRIRFVPSVNSTVFRIAARQASAGRT